MGQQRDTKDYQPLLKVTHDFDSNQSHQPQMREYQHAELYTLKTDLLHAFFRNIKLKHMFVDSETQTSDKPLF